MNEFPQLQIIQQLGRTYRALLTAFDANIGQPMPRWRILLTLYQQGEMSQKTLAHTLRIDPAALTRQVKAIEKLGWVQRHSDASDNRLTNVMLTPAGDKVVRETLPRRSAFVQSALGDLSLQDMEALSVLLDRLEQRLRNASAESK
jgi:DNA-binding MarR family transcriptional regulator